MLSGCRHALLFASCLPRFLLCPPWFLLDMISSCVERLLIVCMSSHGDFLLCLLRPCPLCISPRSIALAIFFYLAVVCLFFTHAKISRRLGRPGFACLPRVLPWASFLSSLVDSRLIGRDLSKYHGRFPWVYAAVDQRGCNDSLDLWAVRVPPGSRGAEGSRLCRASDVLHVACFHDHLQMFFRSIAKVFAKGIPWQRSARTVESAQCLHSMVLLRSIQRLSAMIGAVELSVAIPDAHPWLSFHGPTLN